jgi:hypothetical protein
MDAISEPPPASAFPLTDADNAFNSRKKAKKAKSRIIPKRSVFVRVGQTN